MKTKSLIIPSILAASLLGAGSLYAQPSVQKSPLASQQQKHERGKGFFKNLKPEQRQKLKALRTETKKQVQPIRHQLRNMRVRLNGMIATPNTQWKNIQPIVERMGKLQNRLFIIGTKAKFKAFKETGILLPSHKMKRR